MVEEGLPLDQNLTGQLDRTFGDKFIGLEERRVDLR